MRMNKRFDMGANKNYNQNLNKEYVQESDWTTDQESYQRLEQESAQRMEPIDDINYTDAFDYEYDGCLDENENRPDIGKTPLIGWIGGVGYVITLCICVFNHIAITSKQQLGALLIWLAADLIVNGVRICLHRVLLPMTTEADLGTDDECGNRSDIKYVIGYDVRSDIAGKNSLQNHLRDHAA